MTKPEGLETTAEIRDVWKAADYFKTKPVDTEYMWRRIEMLCRDFDRLLAENARLTAALAEVEISEEEAMSRGHNIGFNAGAKVSKDACTAQIADLVRRMDDDAGAREAKAREEEREACAKAFDAAADGENARLKDASERLTAKNARLTAALDEYETWAADAAEMRERCAKIAETQDYYPATKIGMRQQWVKDQIAVKNQIAAAIRALPLSPAPQEAEND